MNTDTAGESRRRLAGPLCAAVAIVMCNFLGTPRVLAEVGAYRGFSEAGQGEEVAPEESDEEEEPTVRKGSLSAFLDERIPFTSSRGASSSVTTSTPSAGAEEDDQDDDLEVDDPALSENEEDDSEDADEDAEADEQV